MTDVPERSLAPVHISGSGGAALAAMRALAGHGIGVRLDLGPAQSGLRPPKGNQTPSSLTGYGPQARPHLLLNQPTIRLLDDLFGCEAAMRDHAHAVRGRLVCWGSHEANLVEEPGLAIAAASLHRVLHTALKCGDNGAGRMVTPEGDGHGAETWTIEARGRGADDATEVITIGDRVAICAEASLCGESDPSLCAVEAVADGWLFLLPLGGERAVVQAIVPQRPDDVAHALDTVLAQSRLVARLIAAPGHEVEVLSCAPRLRHAPARRGWVAAGDAALSFDPLCGDGTGQALRCGLLAGAVIAAIARGEPEAACLAHYRGRLRRTMLAHLKAVAAFYAMAPCRRLWEREIERTHQELDRIANGDAGLAAPARYRLERLSLVPASA